MFSSNYSKFVLTWTLLIALVVLGGAISLSNENGTFGNDNLGFLGANIMLSQESSSSNSSSNPPKCDEFSDTTTRCILPIFSVEDDGSRGGQASNDICEEETGSLYCHEIEVCESVVNDQNQCVEECSKVYLPFDNEAKPSDHDMCTIKGDYISYEVIQDNDTGLCVFDKIIDSCSDKCLEEWRQPSLNDSGDYTVGCYAESSKSFYDFEYDSSVCMWLTTENKCSAQCSAPVKPDEGCVGYHKKIVYGDYDVENCEYSYEVVNDESCRFRDEKYSNWSDYPNIYLNEPAIILELRQYLEDNSDQLVPPIN